MKVHYVKDGENKTKRQDSILVFFVQKVLIFNSNRLLQGHNIVWHSTVLTLRHFDAMEKELLIIIAPHCRIKVRIAIVLTWQGSFNRVVSHLFWLFVHRASLLMQPRHCHHNASNQDSRLSSFFPECSTLYQGLESKSELKS